MSRFSPLQLRRDVWLNDLAFSNVDEHGNRWIISDIDGWWDLPTPTMGEVDRAYSEDGSYYEPGRFEARVIRMKGKIIPPENNSNAGNIARKELNKRLMLVRKTGLLQVLESPELGGGKQSEVVIVARPLVDSDRLNGVLEFDIQFRAPDPRKYSVTPTISTSYLIEGDGGGRTYSLAYNRVYGGAQDQSTALVVNEGDYDTYGTIRLHGPIDNPGAFHLDADRHIVFPGVRLTVGQYIDINLQEKTITTESGTSLRDMMSDDSRWFKFEVGENRVSLAGTQYIEPVPSIPDVKNLVKTPSYEVTTVSGQKSTVRTNRSENPSGMLYTTSHILRESVFPDPQAQESTNFTEGAVSGGYASTPMVNLLHAGGTLFPVDDINTQHFVQMEVKPATSEVTTAELSVGGRTSGAIPVTSEEWTTIRVDSFVPEDDYEIKLNLPGATSSNKVQLKNIMVLHTSSPQSGAIEYGSPVPGATPDGIITDETGDGTYRQYYDTPDGWTVEEAPDSYLRVIQTGNPDTDGTYLIPGTTEDHIIDFGPAVASGKDITYGIQAEGLKEIRLYDYESGDLLVTTPATSVALNYVSDSDITPRLEATISVDSQGTPIRRKIIGTMITYDGGSKVFTEVTPDDGGYSYEHGSWEEPAVEMVDSYYTIPGIDKYNYNTKIVSTRAYEGSKSLEVVYNLTDEDQDQVKATPITHETDSLGSDTYYVRAKIMTNKPTVLSVVVEGITDDDPYNVGTNPGHWADVSFPFDGVIGARPVLTVTPPAGERDLEIYVDAVGIMTDDVPYFDGSMQGPYEWTGTPHASTSATIPVVGVPTAKMEITHRNAWIG